MVTRKTISKPKVSGTKHRIVVEIPFGKYPNTQTVTVAKRQIKAKSPKIVFSAVKKVGNGYSFKGKITFIKYANASHAVLRQAIQANTPGAKVTVSNA